MRNIYIKIIFFITLTCIKASAMEDYTIKEKLIDRLLITLNKHKLNLILPSDALDLGGNYWIFKKKEFDKDFKNLAKEIIQKVEIECIKNLDEYIDLYDYNLKRLPSYFIFKFFYLNQYGWKYKQCLINDYDLNKTEPHIYFSSFLYNFTMLCKKSPSNFNTNLQSNKAFDINLFVLLCKLLQQITKTTKYHGEINVFCKFEDRKMILHCTTNPKYQWSFNTIPY